MFNNIRTFTQRSLTYREALDEHPMMLEPTKLVMTHAQQTGEAALYAPLRELWGGLCGSVDPSQSSTVIPRCVDWTMPPEYAVVIRRSAGVTTAFAFCELAKSLMKVRDLNDDFEVRRAFLEGWKEFERRRQEANQVQEGFGCDDSQSWSTLRDIVDDKSDEDDLKRKMLAIAELAGRLYTSFSYQHKNQPNEDPEEAVGARQGGTIDRILPTELALLGDDETSDLQALKILKRQATELEMKGVEAKSRGPMVIAIDESGSMHDGDAGHFNRSTKPYAGRNTWAKAAAVALTRIAWQENRAVVAVHFAYGTEVQSVPKDDYRAMFEMARSFLSGGTSLSAAMRTSLAQVGDLEAQGLAGADILLVTDGVEHDYAAQNRIIDEMDAKGVRLWTVAIGESCEPEHPIRKRAERYTFATDRQLGDSAASVDLAEGLNQAAMGNPPDFTLN